MPALAYNDTPMSTDPINQTQAPIRTNFQSIKSLIDINHVDFGSTDYGKHNLVELVLQGSVPSFLPGEVGLYNYPASAPFGTYNELYIHKLTTAGTATAEIPCTASILSTSKPLPVSNRPGWTYLPSGIILQWTQTGASVGNNLNIAFPITFPNACLFANVTASNPTPPAQPNPTLIGFNDANFSFYIPSVPAGTSVNCFAIGY